MVDQAVPPFRPTPTLEEVAERAGVSRSTASRAINGGDRVSPEAMEAVSVAVAELGYTPNRAARSLVTRRTDSVALVVPEPDERVLSDPFFAGVLNGVSLALADSELQLLLLIVRPGDAARTARYLRAGHADGAIVVSHHRDNVVDRALAESGQPTVYIGRPLTKIGCTALIDTDNVGGGRLATEHLIRTGRRRIATITGPNDMSAALDRLTGYRQALAAAGLPEQAVIAADFTLDGGTRAARELVEQFPETDGVFIASDLMATGAIPVFTAAGRVIPDDLAVVGYDNSNLAATTTPALTTITQPVVMMARAAGTELIAQLRGDPPQSQPLIFEPELVVRNSA